jgi:hypothetical protein
VRDAVVVGIPHPIYGEEIVGVVELLDENADGLGPGRLRLVIGGDGFT